MEKIKKEAEKLTDPRRTDYGNIQHKLSTIIIIALCSMMCGGEDFDDMEEFGNQRKQWLEGFLDMPRGIPDKDTFRRLFERLDPSELSAFLYNWLDEICDVVGKTIPLDGKTIRGSANGEHSAYHVVSAWLAENRITLGEVVTAQKSNEITAIPELLDIIDVKGATVTIDAMGCQTKIVEKIIDKGANYCVAVKGNQKKLHKNIVENFNTIKPEFELINAPEKGHGRVVKREYFLDTKSVDFLPTKDSWCGLAAIGATRTTVLEKDKMRTEIRYFITSLTCVKKFADSVRKHWSIEGQLHWHLDVTFGEDDCRAKKDNSPLNLNIMRKVVLFLLQHSSIKTSIKRKKFIAALNIDVLEDILFRK